MEVLTIVAIIAIIAAIAVPNIMSANIKGKVKAVRADMASIAIALENFKMDYGTYPIEPESSGEYGSYGPDEIGEKDGIFGSYNYAEERYYEVVGLGKLVFPFDGSEPTYLHRVSGDIFNSGGIEEWATSEGGGQGKGKHNRHYCYFTGVMDSSCEEGRRNSEPGDTKADYWALVSYGPDEDRDVDSYLEAWKAVDPNAPGYDPSKAYNPENGIISDGDIIMVGP